MAKSIDYSALSREELERRCEAAENVALLYGWTSSQSRDLRAEALYVVWGEWLQVARESAGYDVAELHRYPEFRDKALTELVEAAKAAER